MRTSLRFALLTSVVCVGWLRAADEPKKIEIGFEQRVRTEDWNNLFDYSDGADDQRNQIRYRTRLWTNIPLSSKITLAAGLNQETNQIVVTRQPYRFDEVAFETAYLDFKDLFTKGLSLRVGRQNIMRGEGALFMEGTPWDGSRTIYNNAAVLGYERGKVKVELMGILNPARDRMLPRIHDRHKTLIEWNEQAVGTYITAHPRKQSDVEAYYFLKKETHDTRAKTNAQYQPDRHIHTAGGRLVRRFDSGYTLTGEGARQWGADHAARDIQAWFAFGHVRRDFKTKMKPYVLGGYWAMSGDDPKTKGTVEDFDPLFSRWPKWSELYLYSLFREKGVGYWTNITMWQAETAFAPLKPVNWHFTYYHMGAFHQSPYDQKIFAAGTNRGDMFQTRLDWTINSNWKAHALYETVLPGSFYRMGARSYFIRFEMSYLFKHKFAI